MAYNLGFVAIVVRFGNWLHAGNPVDCYYGDLARIHGRGIIEP